MAGRKSPMKSSWTNIENAQDRGRLNANSGLDVAQRAEILDLF